MDLLQEYKEMYYKEIEHSERLNNKISTCITFITILGSSQVLLWTQFKNFELETYSLIYLIGCILSFLFFVICIFRFYITYSGYQYNYFPIKDMALATIQTYDIAGNSKLNRKQAEKHIYNMYCERFLNDAIVNMKNNEIKNNKHKKLTNSICISFIITIFVFATNICIDYYEAKMLDTNIIHIIIDGGEINVR